MANIFKNAEKPEQIAYQLALWHMPGLSLRAQLALNLAFPNLAELFQLDSKELRALGLKEEAVASFKNPPWAEVEADLNWQSQSKDHMILVANDALYPTLLKEIIPPPLVLFVRGAANILNTQQIAIVGSRNATPIGKEIAANFAAELVRVGFAITSGLALGIDGAAHRGALLQQGKTIAVLGTGVDVIYPRRHFDLAGQILQSGGALVSELPLGMQPLPENFPQRNRIICGLSLGTLVVEASERSGSLITARLAAEAGREVFAVPGSIYNAQSKGCHLLLRQGAKLVENIQDLCEELQVVVPTLKASVSPQYKEVTAANSAARMQNNLALEQKKLLDCVDFTATAVDVLVARSGFAVKKVMALLTTLELNGLITRTASGYLRGSKRCDKIF